MENWKEDTCVVCSHNDTNFLDDCCTECEAVMGNKVVVRDFINGIDAYLGGK
jgi:hypothetical protein